MSDINKEEVYKNIQKLYEYRDFKTLEEYTKKYLKNNKVDLPILCDLYASFNNGGGRDLSLQNDKVFKNKNYFYEFLKECEKSPDKGSDISQNQKSDFEFCIKTIHKSFTFKKLDDKALKFVDIILRIYPENNVAKGLKHKSLSNLAKHEEALEIAKDALDSTKDNSRAKSLAYGMMHRSYTRLGDDESALKYASEMLDRFPDNVIAMGMMHTSLLNLDRLEDALNIADRRFFLDEKSGHSYGMLFRTFEKMGEFQQAHNIALENKEFHPKRPASYLMLSRSYLNLGKNEEALQEAKNLEKVLDKRSSYLKPIFSLKIEFTRMDKHLVKFKEKYGETSFYKKYSAILDIRKGDFESALGKLYELTSERFDPIVVSRISILAKSGIGSFNKVNTMLDFAKDNGLVSEKFYNHTYVNERRVNRVSPEKIVDKMRFSFSEDMSQFRSDASNSLSSSASLSSRAYNAPINRRVKGELGPGRIDGELEGPPQRRSSAKRRTPGARTTNLTPPEELKRRDGLSNRGK